MSESTQKPNGIRRLFIDTMYGGFVALVVFVVGTYMFVIPRMLDQQQRIERLEAEVAALRTEPAEDEVDAEETVERIRGAAEPAAEAPAPPEAQAVAQ